MLDMRRVANEYEPMPTIPRPTTTTVLRSELWLLSGILTLECLQEAREGRRSEERSTSKHI